MYNNSRYTWFDEHDLREMGFSRIAGVDEAGRGPAAGAVVVACVMLPLNHGIANIRDSKKIVVKSRERLYLEIMDKALSVSVAMASNLEIDRMNIFRATEECVKRSILNMKIPPDFVCIDGEFPLNGFTVPHLCAHGADGAQVYGPEGKKQGSKKQIGHHYENVAAASIVAKVYRDNTMLMYDKIWPEYGFKNHKGYLTKEHQDAISKYGLCPIHRRTFKGCKEIL